MTSADQRPSHGAPVTRRMRVLLVVVLALFAALVFNSIGLAMVTVSEWIGGVPRQDPAYLWMLVAHLALGLLIVVPTIVFGLWHWWRARRHPNRRAVRMGLVTFVAAIVTLGTGVALTGGDLGTASGGARGMAYWAHVLAPVVTVWGFVMHRLAGRRIRWRTGAATVATAVVATVAFDAWHRLHASRPRPGPADGAAYFEPSLARTANGSFIPERSLMMNEYCMECHPDAYRGWAHSVHAASSFNNPLYAASVRETRRHAFERDGSVHDARFCAGCHDPVPFLSGAFDDPRFDDPDMDVAADPLASASITCTACHSIVAVGSTRGNADYVVEESPQYPFTFSENPFLRWVNRQLVFAKPSFHRRTWLKPEVHRGAEFCSTCHKVSIPESVNDYRWLPGQNHYDDWRRSGRSGRGIEAWRWPEEAAADCNGCHMPAIASADAGAKPRGPDGALRLRDHHFRGANVVVPALAKLPGHEAAAAEQRDFCTGILRADVFAIRAGGTPDAPATAPLPPVAEPLRPSTDYLLEVMVRALAGMGHAFTQGTADSNEPWIDVTVRMGDRIIGRSGAVDGDGRVDPWSKFLNVWMLDREGRRIDRRNVQDIFVPLYDHQVPAGGAELTRYAFRTPDVIDAPITVSVAVRYRKFTQGYADRVLGAGAARAMPVLTLATAQVAFGGGPDNQAHPVADAERWMDAGIARFRTAERAGGKGQWALADEAFARSAASGDGVATWIGRARVALRDGRVEDAAAFLREGAARHPGEQPWAIDYWGAMVERERGELDRAIDGFARAAAGGHAGMAERGLDFGRDERLLVEWANACLERARQLRADGEIGARETLVARALDLTERALAQDSERARSWWVRSLALEAAGRGAEADHARGKHDRYRPDDNARDRAVRAARTADPVADHAAEAGAIHDLQRAPAAGHAMGAAR
ncbi:MAG: hypothetical protein RI990_1475 [Planctomycetota bacterium]